MKRLVSAAVAAALALCASAAHAQSSADPDSLFNPLRKGARSLSFTAPLDGGTGEAGIWRMVDDKTNVGILVGLGAARSNLDVDDAGSIDNTQLNLSIGVGVRRYGNPYGQVSPYVMSAAYVFGSQQTQGPDDAEIKVRNLGVGARGGLGVEWFPVRRVSIAGETGARLQLNRQTVDRDDEDDDATSTGLNLSTFTSGLSVQIYF